MALLLIRRKTYLLIKFTRRINLIPLAPHPTDGTEDGTNFRLPNTLIYEILQTYLFKKWH